MNPIQIRMLCGAAAGRVRIFEEPELSFGRTPDNTIVIESPHASRQHGALIYDEDGWHVLNASPNGTTVNGKAVGKKKLILKTGDTVGVANQPLFSVEILAAPASQTHEPAPFAQSTFAPPVQSTAMASTRQRRSKLWLGLGGYLGLILVLFVVLLLVTGGGNGGNNEQVRPLSREEIAASITEPITLTKNDRMANESLQQARELHQRADADPTALYEAYVKFKRAGAYSGGAVFQDGLVFREYKKCEEELIERVAKTYADGYKQLRAGEGQQASATFQRLLRMYPDSQSEVYSNVTRQLALARSRSKR